MHHFLLIFIGHLLTRSAHPAQVSRLDKVDIDIGDATSDYDGTSEARAMLESLAADTTVERTAEGSSRVSFSTISADFDKSGTLVLRAHQRYMGFIIIDSHAIMHKHAEHTVDILAKADATSTGQTMRVLPCAKFFGQILIGIGRDLPASKLDRLQLDPTRALAELQQIAQGAVSESHGQTVIYLDDERSARLGHLVSVKYFDGQHRHHKRLADAETGNIVQEWDGIKYFASAPLSLDKAATSAGKVLPIGTGGGGNTKTGAYYYGVGKQKFLATQYSNGTCTTETRYVKTIKYDYRLDIRNTSAFVFDCAEGNVNDTMNGAKSPINDASFIVNHACAMYMDWYGEPALSASGKGRGGEPLQVLVVTHLGGVDGATDANNASGTAYYVGDGEIGILNGNQYVWHPNTVADVLAHELAHGVTEQTSVLVSNGFDQPDGLNEAFSDMAGKAFERYMYGKAGVKWGVGIDMMKGNVAMRYMDEPTRKAVLDDILQGSSIDNAINFVPMYLYFSSGVFNKAFYCMSQKFQNDVWDAFDLFYIANTRYWCPSTNFTTGAELMLTATEDIKGAMWSQVPWGYTWINTNDIADCFKQVGITCTKQTAKLDTNGVQNCNGTTQWNCAVTG